MKRKNKTKQKNKTRKHELAGEVGKLKGELQRIKKRSKGILVDINSLLKDSVKEMKIEERIVERLRGTRALIRKGLKEIKFTAVKHAPTNEKLKSRIEKILRAPGVEKSAGYKKALAYAREHPVGSRLVVFVCEDRRGRIFRKVCVRHHFEIYDPEDERVYLTSEFAHRMKKKGLALLAKGRIRNGRVGGLKFFRRVSF